jgi:5'-methylthioadenosine phosphorylase
VEVCREQGINVHERGTIVVINGPRFSTVAESRWFSAQGWEVIGMTQYPEAYLALEKAIAVVNISLITDYDAGQFEAHGIERVSAAEIIHVFNENARRIKDVVLELACRIQLDLDSPRHHALDNAKISG